MVQLRIYLQALWRNWWIIVLTAVIAVAATLLINFMRQPVYRSQVQLLIVPNTSDFDGRDLIYSLDTLDKQSVVATYVEVINSNRIRREALETVDLSLEARDDYDITAVALPEASVIQIAVEGPVPETTAALTNAAAAQTINYVSQTYDIFRIELLDPAPVPQQPISPTPARDATLALFLGLVLGGILAIFRDQIQQPLASTLSQWNAGDHTSGAYKRGYLENRLQQLLPTEAEQMVLSVVRLGGLSGLDVPAHTRHNLLRRIVDIVRDEVPGRDLIARWDDNSFAVLMRQIRGQEEARIRLDRLQQTLTQPLEVYPGGEVLNLTPRVVAVEGQPGDTVTSLKERLSQAAVLASQNGHEPTLFHEETQQPLASSD